MSLFTSKQTWLDNYENEYVKFSFWLLAMRRQMMSNKVVCWLFAFRRGQNPAVRVGKSVGSMRIKILPSEEVKILQLILNPKPNGNI